VTRRMAGGAEFYPEQCMTREQALRSYTLNAAYAAFEDDIKGSLVVGKLADIVVLSEDIMTVPPEKIRDARVDLTILGGKVVHEFAGKNP
jgi:predicted amidohydrolase YtcJ